MPSQTPQAWQLVDRVRRGSTDPHNVLNRSFKMDMAAAEAESPTLMAKPSCKVTVWVGADERPVFLDQARWLSQAWDAPLVVDADKHHFDVIEGLSDAQSKMTSCLLDV